MSTPSTETARTASVTAIRARPTSRAVHRPQRLPPMLQAEDVARTLLRLQMRIRELEAELTALKAVPAGWR
jgi:hypothetical protein